MGKEKSSNARGQILEAADRLFGELGFDAASTREIAEASGVNKALIHYHFKNKESLFEAVLDRYYERLGATVQSALTRPGSPRERLFALVDAYAGFLAANRNFSRIVQRESSCGKHVARVGGHLAPMFERGLELIRTAYPKTRSGDLEAYHLFISFYGIIVTYFTYSDVLLQMTGKDPLMKKELDKRKKHLHRMLDMILTEIDNGGEKSARPR